MKSEKLLLVLTAALLPLVFSGCSDDEGDTDPDKPSGGKVNISGVSKQYAFWGEEITISGTGFSNVKDENIVNFVESYPNTSGMKFTSNDGDIEIIQSSPTSIKIRVPHQSEVIGSNNVHRGEDYARIEVVVNNERDTSDVVRFIGLPRIGNFEYHYGWYDLGGIARSGDSVVIAAGFYGSKLGAGDRNPRDAGVYDKLRLHVDGIHVPMKWRKISQFIEGYGLYLPAKDFSETNCTEGANGWNDRAMTFRLSVDGTDIENSRTHYITYLPQTSLYSADGPSQVSKSAGGNPFWTVTGDDMYYTHAVFSTSCDGVAKAEIEIANSGTFNNEYQINIPLSLMVENCSYNIHLKTPCDDMKFIGNVSIKP